MRELFFVLVVVLILLALTAIRYRKTIAGVIGMARMLKDVKDAAGKGKTIRGEQPSVQLMNCAECGVWVPSNKAVGTFCSTACRATASKTR